MFLMGGGLFFRKNIKASAICQYAFSDVQKVFEGPYMEVQDSKWREYTGKVPEPRPGSVRFILLQSAGYFCVLLFPLSISPSLMSPVYNRSAQVPGHQLISRPP